MAGSRAGHVDPRFALSCSQLTNAKKVKRIAAAASIATE
jgi:hypothetical protein